MNKSTQLEFLLPTFRLLIGTGDITHSAAVHFYDNFFKYFLPLSFVGKYSCSAACLVL